MLQLTRARNRLTTPATLTLPEIAASGLTVSALSQPLLRDGGPRTGAWLAPGRDTGAKGSWKPRVILVRSAMFMHSFLGCGPWLLSCVPQMSSPLVWVSCSQAQQYLGRVWKPQSMGWGLASSQVILGVCLPGPHPVLAWPSPQRMFAPALPSDLLVNVYVNLNKLCLTVYQLHALQPNSTKVSRPCGAGPRPPGLRPPPPSPQPHWAWCSSA